MNNTWLIFALASFGRLEAQLQTVEAQLDAVTKERDQLAEVLASFGLHKPVGPVDPTPQPVV